MRPQCHDGVTVANGMLYWWPSMCDCQLSIYGVSGLGHAEETGIIEVPPESRLEQGNADVMDVADFAVTPAK